MQVQSATKRCTLGSPANRALTAPRLGGAPFYFAAPRELALNPENVRSERDQK